MQIFFVLYFVIFFDFSRFLKDRLSQILMKPPLSILIFQHGLDFPAPEAIREDRYLRFQELTNSALFRHKLNFS